MSDPPPMTAGGRATEGGMAFQARVGSWFATYVVTRMPLGRPFGIAGHAIPSRIQFETSTGLDDIAVSLSTGHCLQVQCKTQLNLSGKEDSELASVLHQLVEMFLQARRSGRIAAADQAPLDAAVLAVAGAAPRSLDDLNTACRQFDAGGEWGEVLARLNRDKQDALQVFQTHVRAAWIKRETSPPKDDDLVMLARAFRIERFDVQEGASEWREATHLLGARLYGGEHRRSPARC
jgi:hypothetical protein